MSSDCHEHKNGQHTCQNLRWRPALAHERWIWDNVVNLERQECDLSFKVSSRTQPKCGNSVVILANLTRRAVGLAFKTGPHYSDTLPEPDR